MDYDLGTPENPIHIGPLGAGKTLMVFTELLAVALGYENLPDMRRKMKFNRYYRYHLGMMRKRCSCGH